MYAHIKNKYDLLNLGKSIPLNNIDYSKSRAYSWEKSSHFDNYWVRKVSEYFYNCERMSLCACIYKDGEDYFGICIGSSDIFNSPDLRSLMCTLDIIVIGKGILISDPFFYQG